MAGTEASAPRREIELDLLRGLAILAVVDFHSPVRIFTYPFALVGLDSIGAVGVNVFFVLSGFLVGGLLIKEWTTFGRIDAKRFLIRRGFKIWPQFYLFLLLNLVTRHRSWQVLWPAFLNVQNYSALSGAHIPHLWSLAIEEHAYLLLTLILVIGCRWKLSVRAVTSLLILLSALSVCLRMIVAANRGSYFSATHTRIEGILYGVILAVLSHRAPQVFERLQRMRWMWMAALAAAALYLRFRGEGALEQAAAIDFSDLIGVASLMLVCRRGPERRRSGVYRLIAWIGLYSYGIYLWSVSVIGPVESASHHLPRRLAGLFLALGVPLAGIFLGTLMTRVVEFPMLRLREHLFPRRVQSAVEAPP